MEQLPVASAEAPVTIALPAVERDAVLPGPHVETVLPHLVGRHLVGEHELGVGGDAEDQLVETVEQRAVLRGDRLDVGLDARVHGGIVPRRRQTAGASLASRNDSSFWYLARTTFGGAKPISSRGPLTSATYSRTLRR